ncbi:MAG: ABC transporter ATP-binding protein [Butyrivibrio sp.]
MNEPIITVDNVSMRFNLAKEKVDSLKEYIIKAMKGRLQYDEFWALNDVSFTVERGDSVGLIGLNGSGKSTMLKIIARVLKPTKGNVIVNGTVAPLIELGAGFDFDLTGKENIYLNGALLGRSRKMMDEVLEDIIEFSELKEFMDVPMKNYSSGMLSRLAFSIATSGKADILIVDEVLAVGDFRFQQKCIDRIRGMMQEGTTVLFVSHSIEQVEDICNKVVWLKSGRVHMKGDSGEICEIYRQS